MALVGYVPVDILIVTPAKSDTVGFVQFNVILAFPGVEENVGGAGGGVVSGGPPVATVYTPPFVTAESVGPSSPEVIATAFVFIFP